MVLYPTVIHTPFTKFGGNPFISFEDETGKGQIVATPFCFNLCTTCARRMTAQRKELKGNTGAGAFRQCGVTTLKVGLRGGNQ
jgi:hypothetical protein